MRAILITAIFFLSFARVYAQWTIYNSANSPLPDNSVYAIETDRAGNMWIGTDNGLAKFDGSNWTVLDSSNSGLPVNQVRSIAFDLANNLWVGTLQAGFSVYNRQSWANYNTINSALIDNQVRCISFDNLDSAWVGTSGGVTYLGDEGWVNYNQFNSPLGANNITRIFVDDLNRKWIGTINGGIGKKEGNSWTIYNTGNSGLTDNTVLDFESDTLGNLWFATPAHGLGRYNGSDWFYRIDANSNIPTNSISCIEISKETDVKYLGTANKGLLRWSNGLVFDSFTVSNSPIPDNRITCLKRNTNGSLWIGTSSGGIAVFNDSSFFAPIGVVEPHFNRPILVYPNPASQIITLSNISGHLNQIEILDMRGKVILQVTPSLPAIENTININVGSISNGMYMIHAVGTATRSSTRFVKQ